MDNHKKNLTNKSNYFLLCKIEGIKISQALKVTYNAPEDKNKLLEVDSWRNDWINDTLTLNEYRAVRNLQPITGGDVTYSQWIKTGQNKPEINTPIVTTVKENTAKEPFFTKSVEFAVRKNEGNAQNTLIDKALASPQAKSLEDKLTKALSKQLNAYLKAIEDKGATNVPFPKLETYFAFNIMQKELLKVTDIAVDEFNKKVPENNLPKTNVKDKLFFAGEYPQYIIDLITQRTTMLLKGLGNYRGLDDETSAQVNTILAQNADKGVVASALALKNAIPQLTERRAKLIAQTEIGNAVMASQDEMYKANSATSKKFITIGDSRTRESHRSAGKLGWVAIDYDYGGFTRGGQEPNCRCDTIYGFKNEHLNKLKN
jgi:hypothetical protein